MPLCQTNNTSLSLVVEAMWLDQSGLGQWSLLIPHDSRHSWEGKQKHNWYLPQLNRFCTSQKQCAAIYTRRTCHPKTIADIGRFRQSHTWYRNVQILCFLMVVDKDFTLLTKVQLPVQNKRQWQHSLNEKTTHIYDTSPPKCGHTVHACFHRDQMQHFCHQMI